MKIVFNRQGKKHFVRRVFDRLTGTKIRGRITKKLTTKNRKSFVRTNAKIVIKEN